MFVAAAAIIPCASPEARTYVDGLDVRLHRASPEEARSLHRLPVTYPPVYELAPINQTNKHMVVVCDMRSLMSLYDAVTCTPFFSPSTSTEPKSKSDSGQASLFRGVLKEEGRVLHACTSGWRG